MTVTRADWSAVARQSYTAEAQASVESFIEQFGGGYDTMAEILADFEEVKLDAASNASAATENAREAHRAWLDALAIRNQAIRDAHAAGASVEWLTGDTGLDRSMIYVILAA